jgi:membrane protein
VVTLLFGALAVFGQLQDAFDTIWEVKPNPSAKLWRMLRNRLLSFTMLLVIGFLMLVGLVISTILTAVGGYLETRIANYGLFAAVVNGLLPVVFTTVLFAIMFKVLPNVQIAWRDVWPGALLTALLFNLAKYGIGFYLANTRLGTAYGAAGSVLLLLVWVYFSAQIVFLGAEFVQVYVKRHGQRQPVPSADAVSVSEAERAKQGLSHNESAAGTVATVGLARRGDSSTPAGQAPGKSRLSVFIGFLAGVGTGALMAALGLRGGPGRGA